MKKHKIHIIKHKIKHKPSFKHKEKKENSDNKSHHRSVVVFYSRNGGTKQVAMHIAKEIRADLAEIIPAKSYKGITGYFRAGYHAMMGKTPEVNITKDISKYKTIIIGSPNWGGRLASPVRTFINEFLTDVNRVGYFVVQGGSGAERIIDEMQDLVGKNGWDFFVNRKIIGSEEYNKRLKEFCRKLK